MYIPTCVVIKGSLQTTWSKKMFSEFDLLRQLQVKLLINFDNPKNIKNSHSLSL
jgi:hypothetical protein